MFNLKSNLCRLVFNVWWGHRWCFGALFRCFAVWLFSNVPLIDNDIRHHSGQNVVDSRGAAQ